MIGPARSGRAAEAMPRDPRFNPWKRPLEPEDQATELDLEQVLGDMRSSLCGEPGDGDEELRLSFAELASRDPESVDDASIGFLESPLPAVSRSLEDSADSDLLQVRYSVRVATGGGKYQATDNRAELRGSRSYDITALDEFSFGYDERRNLVEIIIDPNLCLQGVTQLAGGTRCSIDLTPDGSVQILKPKGIRLDTHPVLRHADGSRGSFQIHSGPFEESCSVVLPHDPTTLYLEFAEYMLGLGLTEEEDPSYAFTVYLAFRLEPGEPAE